MKRSWLHLILVPDFPDWFLIFVYASCNLSNVYCMDYICSCVNVNGRT